MSLLYREDLYKEERVSFLYIDKIKTLLYKRGESVSLLNSEEATLLLKTKERGESVSLLHRQETDSFSIHRREYISSIS